MERAIEAAKLFVDLMRTGDKIGVVAFNSSASLTYSLTEIDSYGAVKDAAKDAIDDLYASGGTSIGGGLQLGHQELIDKGKDSTGNPDPIRLMILLSDGWENSPPYVADILQPIIDDKITVHTLGLTSDADQELLSGIASQTGGIYRFAEEAREIAEIFSHLLVKVYGENVDMTTTGIVPSGATVEQSVLVDSTIGSMTFSLFWPGSDLDLTLVQPDGRVIDPSVADTDPDISFTSGSTYEFYQVLAPQQGEWKMRIFGSSTPVEGEEYTISASSMDAMIFSVDLDKEEYFTGEPVKLTASIEDSFLDSPTEPEYIHGVTMQVTVEDPALNQRNLELYDDGLHGDGGADDGVYANTFNNASLEGSYNFKVQASGVNNRDGQPFTREYTLSTVFTVNPGVTCDPSNSYVSSQGSSPLMSLASFASDSMTDFQRLPLSFVPNQGQTDKAVRFQAKGLSGGLFFTPGEVSLSLPNPLKVPAENDEEREEVRFDLLPPSVVRVHYQGANPKPEIAATDALPGVVNYLTGQDPAKWHTNLPTYAGIAYRELYPGIELQYQGTDGVLKSSFHVAPGADPAAIRWRYTGATGVSVDESGNLVANLPAPVEGRDGITLIERAPTAWQEVDERRTIVAVEYSLNLDGSIGFLLHNGYDPALPLVIDPELTYGTYLGGGHADEGMAITLDAECNAYVAGSTHSNNFPTVNPVQGNQNGYDVFVSKLNAAGDTLLYSTYIGGNESEHGYDLALDDAGRIVVAGETESADYPVVNPYQATFGGGTCGDEPCDDFFVTQLSADGSAILYSTFLGGNAEDDGLGVAVDASGYIYTVGVVESSGMPVMNPYQAAKSAGEDAYIAVLDPAQSGSASLLYASYLGGDDTDTAYRVRVSSSGHAYVVGYTKSDDFPTLNPYQASRAGNRDVFVAKVDPIAGGSASLL
ncbi:MAG TPA: SBBP repeat-containing protein, partial [Anaerolineales bacterium]|nr:SBBP repeat-containing protein [Anaerolineales bacterium]